MKTKMILPTLFISLLAGSAFSQTPAGPPDPQKQLDRMTQQLNLDASQQEKIKAILQAAEKDREAMKADRLEKAKEVSGKIEQVLNAEQKVKFKEMKEKRIKEMKERKADRKEGKKGRKGHPEGKPESAKP
ncbi:MAG: hypothetical protein LCH54_06525 [Bacteroidetes bacterium]|nr:hypothetical protein [Bacteroidota bacterium]